MASLEADRIQCWGEEWQACPLETPPPPPICSRPTNTLLNFKWGWWWCAIGNVFPLHKFQSQAWMCGWRTSTRYSMSQKTNLTFSLVSSFPERKQGDLWRNNKNNLNPRLHSTNVSEHACDSWREISPTYVMDERNMSLLMEWTTPSGEPLQTDTQNFWVLFFKYVMA